MLRNMESKRIVRATKGLLNEVLSLNAQESVRAHQPLVLVSHAPQ